MLQHCLVQGFNCFRSVSFSNWIEVIKLVAAAVAFWFGLRQYTRSQVWKRLEFLSVEMKNFFADHAVREAMLMLDWRKKRMALFKYREENDFEQVEINYDIVAAALDVDPKQHYDKVHSAIREVFERFLEYLARFEGFLDAGVIEPADLNPFIDYWMKLISGNDTHSPEVTKKVLPNLWRFIDFYGYRDVRRLVSRYHRVTFAELSEDEFV